MTEPNSRENLIVIEDAIHLATVLNKHLSEENCQHSIKEIAEEAFE